MRQRGAEVSRPKWAGPGGHRAPGERPGADPPLLRPRMQTVSAAVEELLVAAQRQDRLTVGVYESAKLMNV